MRSSTIQAPSANLATPTMIATMPVATAPAPLSAARQRQPRSSCAQPPPVAHHPRLAEREGDEDADRVERDQVRDAAAEDDDQRRREHGEHHDADAEGQAVAAELELARHEAVLARMLASRGKSAKAVLAASTSSSAVETWIR